MFNVRFPVKHSSTCKFHLVCIQLLNISIRLFCFDCCCCYYYQFNHPIRRPNDSRRDAWIKNSGNIELYGITTQRRLFCEDHFDPKYLRCQFNRTTLRRDAVPYAHGDINDSEEIGELFRSVNWHRPLVCD